MNDSTIAFRAKEQLGKFLGKVFTHFSKPRKKFLADMLYGIQASGDTQLSSIMRAINDDPDMRHAVEKRLSRNVANEDIGTEIDKAILAEGVKHVRDDSLILVDPTEIRKEFGLRMEHVTMVRDASRSSKEGREVLVHGYPDAWRSHARTAGARPSRSRSSSGPPALPDTSARTTRSSVSSPRS